MPKNNKKTEIGSVPSDSDDFEVNAIRSGKSKADREFMMNDPRFTPEAMEKRQKVRLASIRREWKKKVIENSANDKKPPLLLRGEGL